jgi:hypothetical protein
MKPLYRILSLFLLSAMLAACGQLAATPDLESQVEAALAGTLSAQTAVAQIAQTAIAQTATAAQSVAAEPTAIQPTPTPALPPTAVPLPLTPTPAPAVEATTLTEEELAALIDEAVNEALAASQQAGAASAQASADDTLTSDEIYALTAAVYEAEALLTGAEELMADYYDLYGEYASAALDTMVAMEEELSAINSSLDEIAGILEQGAETASQATQQLDEATAALSAAVGQAQANAQDWAVQVQAALQGREDSILAVPPSQVAGDRSGAVEQVYAYLDTVKQAMGDGKIGQAEMSQIAQLAANAKASLHSQGGPALQNLAGSIDSLTRQLARGEWPQARSGLPSFEGSLPRRP